MRLFSLLSLRLTIVGVECQRSYAVGITVQKNYTFEVKLHGTVLTTVVAAEVWELVAVVGSVASAGKAEHSVQIHQFLSWRVPDDAMQSVEEINLEIRWSKSSYNDGFLTCRTF